MTRKTKIGYGLAVMAVGLLLRILWVSLSQLSDIGDLLYERLAVNILEGHGFTAMDASPFAPTAVRPPLYPLWIAFVYFIFGQNLMPLFYSQTVLGALTIPIVYLIGKEAHSEKTGLLGAFLFAIHPYPQFYATCLFAEVLYSFLLACAILFLCKAWKRPDWSKGWWISGILMGLAALTRSELFLYPLLLIMLAFFLKREKKFLLMKGVAIFSISMGLVLLPWTVRNFVHYKKVIPISDSFYGMIFMVTTLDETEYDQKQHPSAFYIQPPSYAANYPMIVKMFEVFSDPKNFNRINEIAAYDRQAFAIGVEKIKKTPIRYLLNRIKELPYLWIESGNYLLQFIDKRIPATSWGTLFDKPDVWMISWKLMGLVLTSLIPYGFALLGIWRCRHRLGDFLPLLSLPVFVTLAHIPFWIEARYAVPAYPFVLLFTAIGMTNARAATAEQR
ncbi:MAG: glycosyltransferase family 39 protein [Candidatus Omnitrophica bacterium]|nr:glycosyltransferase family 39 protein [Candidatus Omnitrophota bacterium]